MHFVIASIGTRGDVQPYVVLGKELQARGHKVTIATHVEHRNLIEPHGLAHRAIFGSFREMMNSEAGRRFLESGASPARYLKAFRELFAPITRRWIEEADAALADADAGVFYAAAISAIIAAEGRRLPFVTVAPHGTLPTRAFTMGLPKIPVVAGYVARFGFGFLLDRIWEFDANVTEAHLRARGVTKRGPIWRDLVRRGVPHLHLFSEHVVPKPKDWPACAEILGYCFLDTPPSWQPPARLVDFLASGPPPIYVGFGSMTGMQPELLANLTREALRQARQRAVIGMGWGSMRGFEGSDDTFVIDDVPHDWLFPRVAAVVQHCGAGTVAAALRAGRPIVGVPFFADQPTWAEQLHALGVAPPPVPKRKLTAGRLARAITEVVSNPGYAARAATIGAAIRAESGVKRAADRVLHHLAPS